MPSIRKDLKDITKDDVQALCVDKVTEDEQIDFKETVPSRSDKGGDPWREKRAISDYGRDQLLAAVVGFANSYGGDLVIGVREDGGKPGAAQEITPLANCEELAHRLLQQANSVIDPPIPILAARGIVFAEDKSGVVVVRVTRSRGAPHRLTSTKECYQRVRHETLPMTMRQIQDLTFSVNRGLALIDHRFEELQERFHKWGAMSSVVQGRKRVCLRVTCVPTNPECALDKVHGVPEVQPSQRNANFRPSQQSTVLQLYFPYSPYQWGPILRGSEGREPRDDKENSGRISVFCDGAITYEFRLDVEEADDQETRFNQRSFVIFYEWVMALVVNALESAIRFRNYAGASAVEYALEIEFLASRPLPVAAVGGYGFNRVAGTIPQGSTLLPRYSVGTLDRHRETLTLIWRDLWNLIGITVSDDLVEVDPPS